jgi:carbamate kinase
VEDDRALIVVAVGGNALLRRGQPPDLATQLANVRAAAASLAGLADGHRLAITHGNGPQVGLLAARSESSGHPAPLDVLDAETQGQIGYLLMIELANAMAPRPVVTVLTQVDVEPDDPAFAHPTKPIGPVLDRASAARLGRERGWSMARDGPGWRRVVPSPEPLGVVELDAVRLLVDSGVVVVCGGGGGIPVRRGADGRRSGVEAVVDKDLTSALLAGGLSADQLLLLTDVDAVYDGWGTADAAPIDRIGVTDLRSRPLPAGSMGPKAEAACRFVATGGRASIGALDEAADVADGRAGTLVVPDGPGPAAALVAR